MSDVRDPETDQAAPVPSDRPSAHDLVAEDVMERKAHGLRKYSSLLQPNNGRSFTRDAYEEVLDAAMYLRGLLEEEASNDDLLLGRVLRRALSDPDEMYTRLDESLANPDAPAYSLVLDGKVYSLSPDECAAIQRARR